MLLNKDMIDGVVDSLAASMLQSLDATQGNTLILQEVVISFMRESRCDIFLRKLNFL